METFLAKHQWRRPNARSADPHARKLRKRWDDLLRRCAGPIGQGIKPSERKLTPEARAHVERIELEIKAKRAELEACPLERTEADTTGSCSLERIARLEAKWDEMETFLEQHRGHWPTYREERRASPSGC